jgi:ribosomal protein L37AE/L43A
MSLPPCERCGKKEATGIENDVWTCSDCVSEEFRKLIEEPFREPTQGDLFTE